MWLNVNTVSVPPGWPPTCLKIQTNQWLGSEVNPIVRSGRSLEGTSQWSVSGGALQTTNKSAGFHPQAAF